MILGCGDCECIRESNLAVSEKERIRFEDIASVTTDGDPAALEEQQVKNVYSCDIRKHTVITTVGASIAIKNVFKCAEFVREIETFVHDAGSAAGYSVETGDYAIIDEDGVIVPIAVGVTMAPVNAKILGFVFTFTGVTIDIYYFHVRTFGEKNVAFSPIPPTPDSGGQPVKTAAMMKLYLQIPERVEVPLDDLFLLPDASFAEAAALSEPIRSVDQGDDSKSGVGPVTLDTVFFDTPRPEGVVIHGVSKVHYKVVVGAGGTFDRVQTDILRYPAGGGAPITIGSDDQGPGLGLGAGTYEFVVFILISPGVNFADGDVLAIRTRVTGLAGGTIEHRVEKGTDDGHAILPVRR